MQTRRETKVGSLETGDPEHPVPYIVQLEQNCEECGGTGFDPGGVDPWGPEPCPVCLGAKTQTIIRNYLTEAFQIAANHNSSRPVERQHLVAIIQHCRDMVSALAGLPEVPEWGRGTSSQAFVSTKPRSARSRRRSHSGRSYWAARASRERVITNSKGERPNVTFRTQRT